MSKKYGTAIVSKNLLLELECLWNGEEIIPENLNKIEKSLRSFLLSKSMLSSQPVAAIETTGTSKYIDYYEYDPPFKDHLLDYEFIQPEEEFSIPSIGYKEQSYLTRSINKWTKIITSLLLMYITDKDDLFIKWKKKEVSYNYVIDDYNDFYRVLNNKLENANDYIGEDYTNDAWDFIYSDPQLLRFLESYFEENNLFALELLIRNFEDYLDKSINYYVACHRAGMIVFSNCLPSKLCQEFIFSKWPQEIFKSITPEYLKIQRELRGPGFGIELPPLLHVIFSLSTHRDDIPNTIIDLRSEYKKSREELWELLEEMWESPLKKQMKILKTLQDSVSSIIPNISGSNSIDYLSVGLDLAQLSVGGVVSASQKLLGYEQYNKKVSAISFSKKINDNLLYDTQNIKKIINRHLSESEKINFGY